MSIAASRRLSSGEQRHRQALGDIVPHPEEIVLTATPLCEQARILPQLVDNPLAPQCDYDCGVPSEWDLPEIDLDEQNYSLPVYLAQVHPAITQNLEDVTNRVRRGELSLDALEAQVRELRQKALALRRTRRP